MKNWKVELTVRRKTLVESTYAIKARCFSVQYIFECCSERFQVYYHLGGILRVLVIRYPYPLSIQRFYYILCFHTLFQKGFLSFASRCWFSTCILHLLVIRIFFRYFGMSCFICIVWPSLLSSISFDLSLQVVLPDLSIVLFWSSHSNIPLCVFPRQVLYFNSGSLGGLRFYRKLRNYYTTLPESTTEQYIKGYAPHRSLLVW